jgi:hypothetical protein
MTESRLLHTRAGSESNCLWEIRLQPLLDQIEKPARAMEEQIWRELLNGQSLRAGAK